MSYNYNAQSSSTLQQQQQDSGSPATTVAATPVVPAGTSYINQVPPQHPAFSYNAGFAPFATHQQQQQAPQHEQQQAYQPGFDSYTGYQTNNSNHTSRRGSGQHQQMSAVYDDKKKCTRKVPPQKLVYVPSRVPGKEGTYVDASRYKTKMCRNHMPDIGRPCPFPLCCFAHSEDELRSPNRRLSAAEVESLRVQDYCVGQQQQQQQHCGAMMMPPSPTLSSSYCRQSSTSDPAAFSTGSYPATMDSSLQQHPLGDEISSMASSGAVPKIASNDDVSMSGDGGDAEQPEDQLNSTKTPQQQQQRQQQKQQQQQQQQQPQEEGRSNQGTPARRRYQWDPYSIKQSRVSVSPTSGTPTKEGPQHDE